MSHTMQAMTDGCVVVNRQMGTGVDNSANKCNIYCITKSTYEHFLKHINQVQYTFCRYWNTKEAAHREGYCSAHLHKGVPFLV